MPGLEIYTAISPERYVYVHARSHMCTAVYM